MYEAEDNVKRHRGRKLMGGRIPVTLYIEPDVYDALKERAERSDRSVSYVLRRAIRRHLKDTERKAA